MPRKKIPAVEPAPASAVSAAPADPAVTEPPLTASLAPKPAKKRAMFSTAALIVLLLAAAGALAYQNSKLAGDLRTLRKQSAIAQAGPASSAPVSPVDEAKSVVEAVGKLIILPQNEQPTVATVADLSKLQGQPFFANAQVGDKVLIYANAGKAILYRPSTDQIIELAPINSGGQVAGAQTTARLTIEIRNGSGISGQGNAWKNKLAANKIFSVVKVGNAYNGSYPKSIIVDLSNGAKSGFIGQLQSLTNATVTQSLPAGEADSSADAVLIVGRQ